MSLVPKSLFTWWMAEEEYQAVFLVKKAGRLESVLR